MQCRFPHGEEGRIAAMQVVPVFGCRHFLSKGVRGHTRRFFAQHVQTRTGETEVARFQVSPPSRLVVGHVEAMALYAGIGVGVVYAVQLAADVVTDLVSLLA